MKILAKHNAIFIFNTQDSQENNLLCPKFVNLKFGLYLNMVVLRF